MEKEAKKKLMKHWANKYGKSIELIMRNVYQPQEIEDLEGSHHAKNMHAKMAQFLTLVKNLLDKYDLD